MVVDDVRFNRIALKAILVDVGYRVTEADSGEQCLAESGAESPDLILLDIQMEEMDGYETCRRLKERPDTEDIPVIFLSSLSDVDDKVKGFEAGGVDFLTKDAHRAEVLARLSTHLSLRRMKRELEQYNQALEQRVREKVRELADAQFATIYALVHITECRDGSTGAHIERTRNYCRLLAERLRANPAYSTVIDDDFIENLYHAAPLHDIGKVAVPDSVLMKSGELTAEEFEEIKKHTLQGDATLQAVSQSYPKNPLIQMGREIARWHHERWDGGGYPDGLRGQAIPLSAQIMAVADVYDALTSERAYKHAWSHEEASALIMAGAGLQFSPDVVQAFAEVEDSFDQLRLQS